MEPSVKGKFSQKPIQRQPMHEAMVVAQNRAVASMPAADRMMGLRGHTLAQGKKVVAPATSWVRIVVPRSAKRKVRSRKGRFTMLLMFSPFHRKIRFGYSSACIRSEAIIENENRDCKAWGRGQTTFTCPCPKKNTYTPKQESSQANFTVIGFFPGSCNTNGKGFY